LFNAIPDVTVPLPNATGWSDQINNFSNAAQTTITQAFNHGTYCTNGCGGLPEPITELADMRWRYAGFQACPGTNVPVEIRYNSDQREDVLLDYNVIKLAPIYWDECGSCESNEVSQWRLHGTQGFVNQDNFNVETNRPDCTFKCDETVPPCPDLTPCEDRGQLTGCIFTIDAEGETVLVQDNVTYIWKQCQGELFEQYLVNAGENNAEEYTLQQGEYLGDCDTGEDITPEYPCYADSTVKIADCDLEALMPKGYIQKNVNYNVTCTAFVNDGRYTTAPDTVDSLVAFSLTSEDLDGNEIFWIDDPAGTYSWRDYLEGGRLEELLKGLGNPYEFSWEYAPLDGENTVIRIIIKMCVDDVQSLTGSFNGGDATINFSTEEITFTSSGVLATDVCSGETALIDCFGNILEDYEILPEEKCVAVQIKPQKDISTETLTYCAFLDGNLNNCESANVIDFIRVIETCIEDGIIVDRSISDFETDGITPLDTAAFNENTVTVECEIDVEGNVLICHETCYVYSPPVLAKPVKQVTSVKEQVQQVKQLQQVSVKQVLKKAEAVERVAVEREAAERVAVAREAVAREAVPTLLISNALGNAEELAELSPFVRGTCLKVRECCPCGDPDNIVSQKFFISLPSGTDYTEVEPFEVDGLWKEKPCDPALDCPTETKVDLGECTLAEVSLEKFRTTCVGDCAKSAIRAHCGRPNTTLSYSYGPISGDTLGEFVEAWEENGGKTWVASDTGVGAGECHWYCPAIEGVDFIIDGVVLEDTEIVSPNPNAEALDCEPVDALRTLGCFDEEIAGALEELSNKPSYQGCFKQTTYKVSYNNGAIKASGDSCWSQKYRDMCGEQSGWGFLNYDHFNYHGDICDWIIDGEHVVSGNNPITDHQEWADLFTANDSLGNIWIAEPDADTGVRCGPHIHTTTTNPLAVAYDRMVFKRNWRNYTVWSEPHIDVVSVDQYDQLCDANGNVFWQNAEGEIFATKPPNLIYCGDSASSFAANSSLTTKLPNCQSVSICPEPILTVRDGFCAIYDGVYVQLREVVDIANNNVVDEYWINTITGEEVIIEDPTLLTECDGNQPTITTEQFCYRYIGDDCPEPSTGAVKTCIVTVFVNNVSTGDFFTDYYVDGNAVDVTDPPDFTDLISWEEICCIAKPEVFSGEDGGTVKHPQLLPACYVKADGTNESALIESIYNQQGIVEQIRYLEIDGVTEIVLSENETIKAGCCDGLDVDTCFLPDQYAVQWAWAGDGRLQSYDPLTDTWTDWGQTIDPDTGNVVGGFALAFANDTVNPVIYYQVRGNLYKSDPSDPINTFQLVGPTLPEGASSYPCFAFDPSGRLLMGIGSGSTVIEVDPATGDATNIGQLIDARDGAPLSAGPGDWYFDPNGDWFMMARDNRGASFQDASGNPLCTGTVLWKIDPSTLEAVRVSDTCSPVSGTGAEWLNGSVSLLSHGDGTLTQYNSNTDEWTPFATPSNGRINDLSAQWIIPEPIRVFGTVDKNKANEECNHCLYTLEQDENNQTICKPFVLELPGKWGQCETEGNPFVSDPFDSESNTTKNPDQVWNEGCSDAGTTLFRTSCDPAGNEFTEYLYGTIEEPTSEKPPGFRPSPCALGQRNCTTNPFCNGDVVPNTTVYQRECDDGTTRWFDETGVIQRPTSLTPGECPNLDPLLPISEQVVCFEGMTYIRRVSEQYIENPDTGLPELNTYQIIWFNEDGTFYDSTVLTPDEVAEEPGEYYLGDCVNPYIEVVDETLCEIDARYLLLIDSGGSFARYSFLTKTWTNVDTLSVSSAGGSADVENFRLYNFVAPNQLTVIDVNSDTQLPSITLTAGNLNPASGTVPLTFSAAAFREADGRLYAWDTGGTDAGLYAVNVSTGVVDFISTITGVVGTGTSIAIDNTTDTLIINGSNLSYDVDWVAGTATPWGNPPIRPNGSTFDTEGGFYVTSATDTYYLPAGADPNDADSYELLINDWTPGANSMAYYEVVAPSPREFLCRFGILEDGSRELIGTYNITCDDELTERTVVGEIVPCSHVEVEKLCDIEDAIKQQSDGGSILCDGSEGNFVEPVKQMFKYYKTTGITDTLLDRQWEGTHTIADSTEYTTEYGRNIRENLDFSTTPTVSGTRTNLALDDANNASATADSQVVDGYIVVTAGTAGEYRYSTNSEGYYAIELGYCCGPMVLAQEYGKPVGTNLDFPTFTLPEGIHKVRLWNIDSGASNSNWTLQRTPDSGATWVTANTDISVSQTKPLIEGKLAYVCAPNTFTDLEGNSLDFTDETLSVCEPKCNYVPIQEYPEPEEPPKVYQRDTLYRYTQPENGVNVQYWGDTDNGGNAAPHGNVSDIFTDALTHVNGAPDVTGVVPSPTTDSGLLNILDPAGPFLAGSTGTDQFTFETWVITDQETVFRDNNPNTGERVGVYVSECGCKPTLVREISQDTGGATPSSLGEFVTVPAGITRLIMQVADLSAFGGFQLQQSTDSGATWSNVNVNNLYTSEPQIECIPVWVCVEDGTISSYPDRAEEITFNEATDHWCDPSCKANPCASSGSTDSQGGTDFEVSNPDNTQRNFSQVINGNDGGAGMLGVSATLVMPPATRVRASDFGAVDGVTVPVGYTYNHESEDQTTLTDNVALTSSGNAYWVVTRRFV
jgi:hypothetical protein